jgi:acetoin utilization deacetylase AcuC-like enzyme
MMRIPVFYRPEQSCDAAKSFSPSAGKPRLVIEDWLAQPEIAPRIELKSFEAADDLLLENAHDPKYVAGVFSGRHRNGFGNTSGDVADSLRFTVGSIVAAADHVLTTKDKVACSPTSGFHHAGYSKGGGFCTFNGLMVAAITAHELGLADRILIVDLDAHWGDGTFDIIRKLGVGYIDQISASQCRNPAQVLRRADLGANRAFREGRYDLVLYQAGADLHVDDPLGGMLTTDQMRERDDLVFAGARRHGVPIVWNLAGGYQRDDQGGIAPVLALHRATMQACLAAS